MPHHEEHKILPYTPAQVFALVLDVRRYTEFLPWCHQTRVYGERDADFKADVIIGYKMIHERYSCRVHFERDKKIDIEYLSGPFSHLANHWYFEAIPASEGMPSGGCAVHFHIDFEFKSKILQKLASNLFYEVVKRMVAAFEERAKQLYGEQL